MEETARLILLTGASSTGKSALGRALQRATRLPAYFVPADDLDLPSPSAALQRLGQLSREEVKRQQLLMDRAYVASLAVYVIHGFHAIGEVICKDGQRNAAYMQGVGDTPLVLVRLVCSVEVRRQRESERGDRPLGLSDVTTDDETPPSRAYDLELDTTVQSPEDAAREVLRLLHQ